MAAGSGYDQLLTPDGKKVCVRTDVTDDRNAADSFRLLFENNPVPMWVVEKSSHEISSTSTPPRLNTMAIRAISS